MMFDVERHETLFLLQHDSSGGRLPSVSEEPEKTSDSQEPSALATCEVQKAASGDLHPGIGPCCLSLLISATLSCNIMCGARAICNMCMLVVGHAVLAHTFNPS